MYTTSSNLKTPSISTRSKLTLASLGTSALLPQQNALRKMKASTTFKLTLTPIPTHPSLASKGGRPSSSPLPETLNNCQSLPPAIRLSISSDLHAVDAHMHVTHKKGLRSKKVLNQQSIKCYTIYQELIKDSIFEKDKLLILEKCKCLRRKEKCNVLLYGSDIQPKACRSVQPHRRPTSLPHLPKAEWHLPRASRLQPSHFK